MKLDIYIAICLMISLYNNLSIFFMISCISLYYNYEFYSHIKEVDAQVKDINEYLNKVKKRD